MICGTVAFDGENIFAALFDNNVEPEFTSTVLAFDVVALVLQKFYDLFFKWRFTIYDV